MFRQANLPILLALAVGAVGGWAGASGKFDSLLKAEQKATVAATEPAACPPGGCCDGIDPAKAVAALAAHNAKVSANAQKDSKKPNIVVIMADDVGVWNISAYHRGMMGGRTPNIDRIAKEGALFTDYYAQQSCTAGRAAFILGQTPFRTGLLKVGMPAAKQGLQDKDPTIAELLKPHGYAPAQIGKNHLGDRNEYLPTVHGFDEFFGNLYHLNAEEEPELPDYPNPKDFPHFRERFGPRGVLDCKATDADDATVDPRFGRVGRQTVHDTAPLTKKRMETIDDDIAARYAEFI